MRAVLRVVAGLILVTAGVLSLAGGVVAWVLGGQRTDSGGGDQGAFVATLAPLHTDGYSIVVPDVADVLARHGVGRYLGDGRLTVTVRSALANPADQIVVSLVPAGDALRHLAGTARTEIRTVGYTTGDQPVLTQSMVGGAPTRPTPWELDELAGHLVTVSLDVPASQPTALVIGRADGASDFTVAVTVGFAPSSWGTATTVLLITGCLGTLAGLALLVLRRPWIDADHPLLAEPFDGFEATRTSGGGGSAGDSAQPPEPEVRPHASPYVHTAT